MKVFISWSGERSKLVALALRSWLKRFSPALQPWVSSVDIQKGFSWDSAIATELNESKVGIICLTSDNLSSPYLHYEAGAISNISNSHVYTFLYQITDTDVKQPLSRFQNTKYEKNDILQLMRDVNFKLKESGETHWDDDALEENFEILYPILNDKLEKIPSSEIPKKSKTNEELLEEVLRTVRGLQPKAELQTSKSEQWSGTPRDPIKNSRLKSYVKNIETFMNFTDTPISDLISRVDEIRNFFYSNTGESLFLMSTFYEAVGYLVHQEMLKKSNDSSQ